MKEKEDMVVSSDDEAQPVILSVSKYHLEDGNRQLVSFSVLPIQWGEFDIDDSDAIKEQVFLHGFADNRVRKIMVPVTAWRFDLSNVKPEISLLSKDKRWIKLQKPRKRFQDTIRTILITLHFLHRVKKNPKMCAKSVWRNLFREKQLSCYEFKPSRKDLLDHVPLISEAAKRDAVLAESKLLLTIMEEKLGNMKLRDEEVKDLARPAFIVGEIDNDMINEANEESEAEDDLFDSVCALCDNGGNVLCCEGPCMRSFHATKEDGRESSCDSLGLTQKEVDEIQSFYCKNCKYDQHQCFACGKLGSSCKVKGAEVMKCASATCGRFYHPYCVAKLLPQVNKHGAEELERNIADGNSFICPIHYCCVCKEVEDKTRPELQFAVCRRCPQSYHRKCLPREIAFEDKDDDSIIQRAWEGLLSNNRILIYCLNHEIDEELVTPKRDHIKFPNVKATVQEIDTTNEKMKPATRERVVSNKNNVNLDNSSGKSTAKGSKVRGELSSDMVGSKKSKNKKARKSKANGKSRPLAENKRSISKKFGMPDCEDNQPLRALMNKGSKRAKPDNQVDNVVGKNLSIKPTRKLCSALHPLDADSEHPLDADSEQSVLALYKKAASSVTLETVLENLEFASEDNCLSMRNFVEETITMGKLEGSVDAMQVARRMLEGGCSIQDVKAVCGPEDLKQIFKWKIVDKLHWYVQDYDLIVDFCCGANDFSILMNKKLEETGKKCSYQNYDLFPTKNDFCFEMRDWMKVQTNELPTGSQLIMGLHPPVGLKAALANKFIDKALEFKPKLLILITSHEVERLDKKQSPYDLVWEDENFLSGKSFYLPGSVDDGDDDGQIDEMNGRVPLLSLWSRPDWTTKHKFIALEHGHVSSLHEISKKESFNAETLPADHTVDGSSSGNLMPSHDLLKSTDDQEDRSPENGWKRSSHDGDLDQESQEEQEYGMTKSGETSRKRKCIGTTYSRITKWSSGITDIEEQHRREEEKHLGESDTRHDGVVVDGVQDPDSRQSERSATQSGHVDGLLGFAPGPHHAYSLRNSAGWLDE